MAMNLQDIYGKRTTPDGYGDKGTAHSYIPIYEALLGPIRSTARAVLEIGVGPQALSLQMWREFFPNATIFGIDVDSLWEVTPDRIQFVLGDAYSAVPTEIASRQYDLIIDDGSHALHDQLTVIEKYRPLLAPGGLLVIEDVVAIELLRHAGGLVFDLRYVKGRYDDVLVVFQALS
jgi:SAM-dependent methyltransferase